MKLKLEEDLEWEGGKQKDRTTEGTKREGLKMVQKGGERTGEKKKVKTGQHLTIEGSWMI